MSSSSAAGAGAAAALAAPRPKPSKYVCGSCGHCQELSQRDQVRCRVCGYRVFYKTRTERRKWPRLSPAVLFLGAGWRRVARPRAALFHARRLLLPSPRQTRSRPIRRALASSSGRQGRFFPPAHSRRHGRTYMRGGHAARATMRGEALQSPQTSVLAGPVGHPHASSHQLSDARAQAPAAAGGACACLLRLRPIF